MTRGELYRVAHPSSRDPKRSRVFVVVSRQVLIGSHFSTVICAPIYSVHDGLKHESSIHCDELVSLPKVSLNKFYWDTAPSENSDTQSSLASCFRHSRLTEAGSLSGPITRLPAFALSPNFTYVESPQTTSGLENAVFYPLTEELDACSIFVEWIQGERSPIAW